MAICAGLAIAAGAGYGLCQARNGSSVMPVQWNVPFEFYLTEHSFSEVENTRSKLEALASQFVTELRVRHDASAAGLTVSGASPSYSVEPLRAIDEVCAGIEEFKGTEQEMVLAAELLYLLKKQGLSDRWLDVYLGLLYEHPTQPMIGRCAKDAVATSELAGRQAELTRAFDFLQRIPLDFPGKEQVMAVAPQFTELAAPKDEGYLVGLFNGTMEPRRD